MIIAFNSNIFQQQYVEVLKDILLLLVKKDQHFVEMSGLLQDADYIYKTDLFSHYLSNHDRELLNRLVSKKPNQLHKTYLTKITVGTNVQNGEISPNNVLRILQERSKIILENLINDWNFLRGVCDKYTAHSKRKNIYLLIQKAITNQWLEADTGGGQGELKKVIELRINSPQYRQIEKYKLMCLFDSDRVSGNTNQLDNTKIKLISFLKTGNEDNLRNIVFTDCNYQDTDLIIWHILYKKKLENYIPLKIILEGGVTNLTTEQVNILTTKTLTDLDFLEYKDYITLRDSEIKRQFPEKFLLSFSYQLLETICEHHKVRINETEEEVSEMEQILLKIAKII